MFPVAEAVALGAIAGRRAADHTPGLTTLHGMTFIFLHHTLAKMEGGRISVTGAR